MAGQETMTEQKVARIFIVDDHPAVREGLAIRIASHPDLEVCGEAEELEEALAGIKEHDPDAAIVDIQLKGATGLDLIKRLRAEDNKVRVLVWSSRTISIVANPVLGGAKMVMMKTPLAVGVLTMMLPFGTTLWSLEVTATVTVPGL